LAELSENNLQRGPSLNKELIRNIIFAFGLFCLEGCAIDPSNLSDNIPKDTDVEELPYVCTKTPSQKGSRILGYDILDSSESGSFNQSLQKAKTLGLEFMSLHLDWSQIETTAGAGATSGNFEDPSNFLATLNQLSIDEGIKISLTIRPVDTTGKTVPSDLDSVRFNDANLNTRFQSMLAFVFSKISPSNLTSLMVGNEIDTFDPGIDTHFWSDYGAFLFNTRLYLQANHPPLQLGFVGTFKGLTAGTLRDQGVFTAWSGVVDVVGATYYPINADFSVKDPASPIIDFQILTDEFSGKPIHVQEAGYQSAALNGSNERKQSEFFCYLFSAWDNHATHIESMSILRLHDFSQSAAETIAANYGNTDTGFVEYLRTLGIVDFAASGTNKEAFDMIKAQSEVRGW